MRPGQLSFGKISYAGVALVIFVAMTAIKAGAVEPLINQVLDDGFEDASPLLYPADRVHSPISAEMVATWLRRSDSNGVIQDNVFAKMGDSKLVSTNALNCFAGQDIDLAANTNLQLALDYYLGGDAVGETPFERSSLATSVGRTASWLIAGTPPPIENEFTAIWPRITLIAFGESDMSLLNLDLFANSLLTAVDYSLARGSVPVIYSSVPCADCSGGAESVARYRRMARAVAQHRQVPFLDLFLALDPLPDDGLSADGINMNVYRPAGASPCILDNTGLEFGYNMFNLVSLQLLDRLSGVLIRGNEAPDQGADRRLGRGSMAEPVIVDRYPFADGRRLGASGRDDISSFSGCSEDGTTAGPEIIYELDFAGPVTLKVELASRDGADLDFWLFDAGLAAENCVSWHHKTLEAELSPGTWFIVVEAFQSGSDLRSGEYILSMDAG